MGLKNFQYNQILQKYDAMRLENKHILDRRRAEIERGIPEYRHLEDCFSQLSLSYARASLTGVPSDYDAYRKEADKLKAQKSALLTAHGYAPNYLEPIYTCSDCMDTGYISPDSESESVRQKCHCFKQAIVNMLYEQANLGPILQTENFNTFRYDYYSDDFPDPVTKLTPLANIRRVVADCREFIQNFHSSYENLLLYGNTGVGKTFLANCISRELLDLAYTVVYLTAFELFDILERNKFDKFSDSREEIQDQFHYILNSDLLIIDDLGTEMVNSFSASQLYLCINERHLNGKSTIISTNLSLDDISSLYSERVFSRIISDYKLLKITGEDIRLKKAFKP